MQDLVVQIAAIFFSTSLIIGVLMLIYFFRSENTKEMDRIMGINCTIFSLLGKLITNYIPGFNDLAASNNLKIVFQILFLIDFFVVSVCLNSFLIHFTKKIKKKRKEK